MSKEAATRHLLDSISRWGRTPAPGTARSDIEVSPAAARPVTRAAALLVGALAALLLCWAAVPPVHAQIEDTAPGQVQGLTVTPGYGRLAIGWTRMPDATGYKVQWKYGAQTFTDARAIYRESIIDSTLVTTHVITGLVNGNTYTVRMIATKSGASDGLPSDDVSGTPQNIPPAQVQGLNVTPGDTVLTLEWTQVTDATGYKVQWKSGAQSFANAASDNRQATLYSGSTTRHKISGLTNGTAYAVRVFATKRHQNDGTPSEEVTETPPIQPPAQVQDLAVTPDVGRLALRWTPVPDANGYKVQWKSGAQTFANAASDDREYTIHFGSANNTTFTGLTNGIAYTVRVIATKRGASDGTPSEEVTGTQAFPPPAQVQGLTVTPGDTELTLDWTPVPHATGYKVQWKSGAQTFTRAARRNRVATLDSGSTARHSISGLTNGIAYTVRVIATRSGASNGTPSEEVTETPPIQPPAQVQGLTVTPGNGRLTLGWTPVPDATGYKVQWKSGAQSFANAASDNRQATLYSGSTTRHSISGLTNGTAYAVRVFATKRHQNDGTPSEEVTETPPIQPPAQVQDLAVTPDVGRLALRWTPVPDANGYKVQWKSGAQTFANAASDDREYTIHFGSANNTTFTGLTNGIAYTVRVIATKRGASDGTPSEEVTGTQAFPPLPELTIEDARATEGAGVVFTVTLSRAATDAVTVAYSTSDDTATGGADYTTVSNRTLTLTAGSTRGTFTIATTPDALAENDETFTVTLSSPSSNAKLGTAQTATGTIEDDEGTPTLTIENALAAEGEDVEFTVNLSPASSGQVTVQYTTSAATATSGTDYTAASARTLTIAAGATRATLTIATTEDTEDENDETFTVTLASSSANAVLGTAKTATGTIVDDDAPVEASSDATLVGLEVHVSIQEIDSSLTLTPAFDSETSRYTARTSQLPAARIELERSDDRASVVITDHFQELDLTTAENEGTVALVPGDNTVTVTVTAADGVTTRTYTITVNTPDTPGSLTGWFGRVPESHDGSTAFEVRLRFAEDIATTLANLENAIEIENATLSNLAALDSSQSIYTMDITPSSAAPLRISVLHTLHCEQESHAICTAEGDRFKGTNRWVSTADDARLRAMWLVPEGGNRFPLNPVFDSDTTEYRAALAGEFSNLTLQAAPYNRGVTVTVTGPATPEVVDRWDGGVTATLSPPVGFSTWTVRVTAVDDVTTKTYTIAVIRSQPPVLDPPGRIFVLTEAPGFQGGSSLGWTSCLSCGTSLLHRGCIGAGTGWSFRR